MIELGFEDKFFQDIKNGKKTTIGKIDTELTGIKIESKHDIREFKQLTIEDCIDTAYNVIKNRTGSMKNGTFVKNER